MIKISLLILSLGLIGCGNKKTAVVGANGLNGQSCYAQSVLGGVEVLCGSTSTFIPNGINGTNGTNGSDGQDGVDGQDGSFDGYLEYVTICPLTSGSYKETLLYLDGQYLAFLSDPNYHKQRLVILEENTVYTTTDSRNVSFSISNGQIICL